MNTQRINVHIIPDRAYYKHSFEKYFQNKWHVLWNPGIIVKSSFMSFTENLHYHILRRKNNFDPINNLNFKS